MRPAGQHRVPAQRLGQAGRVQVRRGQAVDDRPQFGVGLGAELADDLDLGPARWRRGSRAASTAAARACARRLNSFCVTASCRSRASRERSSRTDSSRLRSYRRALVRAMAACAANRESSSSSRSVNPRSGGGGDLVGREDDAQDLVAVLDRDAEEVGQVGMRGGPALEARVRADVGQPFRAALAQQHARACRAGAAAGRSPPTGVADPVHHELGERPVRVGYPERGVPGADQRPGRAHDHLQHVPDGQLPGDRQHDLADLVQLVEPVAQVPPTLPGPAGARIRPGPRTIGPGRAGRPPDVRGRRPRLASA